MIFEWDEVKRETVLSERGIDFLDLAASLFDGRPMITMPSRRGEAVRLITARRARDGEGRTDWRGVDATTAAEIESQAREDEAPDEWCEEAAAAGLPPRKSAVNIRLDQDILDFFKKAGPGYQTRINAVLRTFVEHRRAKP
jgi:uncharacterized protein (DUF4415 family)